MKNKIILTGAQSTGNLHIGNYFGAIKPTIDFSTKNETILFIADIHSLTTIKDPKVRKENIYNVLSAYLALGFDFEKNILFKQSDVAEVCELSFYLNCFTQFNTLHKAHAFKEKSETNEVNVGLFTYPVLMAADILMYDAHLIPVGRDQLQHLEITRTLANIFNKVYGKTFVVPEPYIVDIPTIIGTDGRKMSKSYNNYIDMFEDEKKLKKKIGQIVTNSAGVNDPKEHENCNVFKILSLFINESEKANIIDLYKSGISYSEIKNILFEKIIVTFKDARITYNEISKDFTYLDSVLEIGKNKAKEISANKMYEVKTKLGFK